MKHLSTPMLCLLMLMTPAVTATLAQEDGERAHVTVENPARLSPAEANRIYVQLKARLAQQYAVSKLNIVSGYQSWRRYNSSPYLSSTHGQRYINSYANALGSDYGKVRGGQRYPTGTVFAKDSITVTSQGKTFPGALFVMEKLAEGHNAKTGDWRYVMIMPDGSTFGDTLGDEPELVEYCHACHQAKASSDYVFFVPKAYRISP